MTFARLGGGFCFASPEAMPTCSPIAALFCKFSHIVTKFHLSQYHQNEELMVELSSVATTILHITWNGGIFFNLINNVFPTYFSI